MKEIDDTSRIRQILDSCRDDAAAQVAVVREMLTNGDASDVRSLAIMAMAVENTANTVEKFYQLNLDGIEHGLA
jgi:hypothetical protein